jgi:hypothetical protein
MKSRINQHQVWAKIVRILWDVRNGGTTGDHTLDGFLQKFSRFDDIVSGRGPPPYILQVADIEVKMKAHVEKWKRVKEKLP